MDQIYTKTMIYYVLRKQQQQRLNSGLTTIQYQQE